MLTPIEGIWEELRHNTERPVFRRVDETHTLDLYAGLDIHDARILMLVTPEEPPTPLAYDAITIASRHRADGTWALLIELKTTDLIIPFARLCQDLIDATRNCNQSGATILLTRLARWRRLMELARNEALSEQALRGLHAAHTYRADDGTPLMVAALAALGLFLVGGAGWAWHHRTSRYFPA